MTRSISFVSLMFGAAALAGCASAPAPDDLAVPESEEFSVGLNLVDEECRAYAAADPDYARVSNRVFRIFCGEWEHPSARIFEVPVSDGGGLERWVAGGWWKSELERRVVCEQSAPTTLFDDTDALIMECRLKNGGWPYAALAAPAGDFVYLADSIPSALNVVERTIGVASGRLQPDQAEETTHSAMIRRLEAALGGRLYGTGDLQTYYQLMSLGQYYDGIKDFVNAEKRYREALALHERLMGANNPESMDPLMHLALELSNQGRFAEAEAVFARAATFAERAADKADYARYLSYRAIHAANQGSYQEALALAREATSVRRDLAVQSTTGAASAAVGSMQLAAGAAGEEGGVVLVGSEAGSAVDAVQSMHIEAAMLERLGQPVESQRLVRAAEGVLGSAPKTPPLWEPSLLKLDGSITARQGAYSDAEQRLMAAIALWEQRAPRTRPAALAHLELGRLYRESGRTDEALEAFRTAMEIIKSRGGGLRYDQVYPYLETAYDVALERPALRGRLYAEMFEASQLVQSGITARQIALAAARLASTDSEVGRLIRDLQDAEDERRLLEQAYEAEIGQFSSAEQEARLEELSSELVAINQRIQELSAQVQAAAPRYQQLVGGATDAQRVLELLGPDEALVHVLVGEPESMVFLLRGGQVTAYPLRLSERELAAAVNRLRRALRVGPDGGLTIYDVETAHRLYEAIFGPFSAQMEDVSHLVSVPSGSLLSFPFGLLVTEPPPAVSRYDYRGVAWLAERTAVSLLPSVRSFVDLRAVAQPSDAPRAFIGFGNSVPFSRDIITQTTATLPEACRSDPERLERYYALVRALGPLPGTEVELKQVAATFMDASPRVVLGKDFTEQAVAQSALEDYRIVYFATHALLPFEIECQPEPSLMASPSPGHEGDGFIQSSEILRFDLNADLVVLSACNTGGPGLETGGESLSGLARAFFYAGARSMLVSHWAVEDIATATLITRVFEGLRWGDAMAAEALRTAQLSLIEEAKARNDRRFWSHPFFWGAFTFVGDGARSVTVG